MKFTPADRSTLEALGLFDAEWYRGQYPDVDILGMDPLEHFLWLGGRLMRNPGPKFDTNHYLRTHKDVARNKYIPVLHYIRFGRAEGRRVSEVKQPPILPSEVTQPDDARRLQGEVTPRQGRPTVMLCSHSINQTLFGGERSFTDMIEGLDALGYNVIVAAPGQGNRDYFDAVRRKSVATYVLRYGWWRAGHAIDETVVAAFARIIRDEGVDVVHTNTIVLREPLLAARRMGARSVIHVRELIQHDAALLNQIGESAEHIVDWIWDNCDHVIANSEATGKAFEKDGKRPSLVYNTADFTALAQLAPPTSERPMRVGLISSNLPKKGINDFAQIALAVSKTHPEIAFHLIGPETKHTNAMVAQVADGHLPQTLRVLGYRETPAQAVAEADVIVSLSLFQESFGRTVLEGMAAGRPVIVYRHGAPPEFVDEGETGFIVPLGDTEAVAAHLRRLADDRGLLHRIGQQAKAEVARRFNSTVYAERMGRAYETLNALDSTAKKLKLPARAEIAPSPRAEMKIAYFCWHFPVPSETFVLNELRLLVEQGHDVTVYCKHSPHPDFKPDFAITWERVRDADHLAARLTATGRTMVHAHFVYPTVTDMVWPACEAAKVPFTFIAHAQDIFRHATDAKNRIDEIGRSPLCAKVFVPSRFHRQYLAERGVPEDKMMINANGCDVRLYRDGWFEGREKRPFRRIVAIHRFTEKKGLIHLIRAGKLLAKDEVRIEIYGYGELEEDYRRAITEGGITNVHLCGPVEGREAMLNLYRESDLFACPSVRAKDGDMDGVPTVLMEAMAAGLPVLTTDLSGIPDLVEDGVTGFVCEATPAAIASRIRAYYALPEAAVSAIIDNAYKRIAEDYNSESLVENLLRVWTGERIDLLIVSWNNLAEITEVTRRLFKFTSMSFHLIICDNGSGPETLAFLMQLYAERDNVTIILNRENAFVGPGTNICLENGQAEYAIYVCGKEGMTTRHGWEKPFVSYMNSHPRVGLAGTLCHSPTYLFGRDYPKGQPLFDKFRNQEFALTRPDRSFAHVQGGFFVMRRSMTDQIGGFSDAVPHNSTDVEFSYYAESCGWELGEVPRLISLYNKTRPGLYHRIDETVGAAHPPTLADLDALDAIAAGEVHHCNACGKSCAQFEDVDGPARCPHCGATRRARSLHRALAESILLYRRLPALGVNVPKGIASFWTQQFQGRVTELSPLMEEIRTKGRTENADGQLDLVMLNDVAGAAEADNRLLMQEVARLIKPGGTLILAGGHDNAAALDHLGGMGLRSQACKRYASKVSHYDWNDIHFLIRDDG
ncbi:MAG: glycosyltransferase [Paracoccaceae bacterium]